MPIVLLSELGKTPASGAYDETYLIDGIYGPDSNATLVLTPQVTQLTRPSTSIILLNGVPGRGAPPHSSRLNIWEQPCSTVLPSTIPASWASIKSVSPWEHPVQQTISGLWKQSPTAQKVRSQNVLPFENVNHRTRVQQTQSLVSTPFSDRRSICLSMIRHTQFVLTRSGGIITRGWMSPILSWWMGRKVVRRFRCGLFFNLPGEWDLLSHLMDRGRLPTCGRMGRI